MNILITTGIYPPAIGGPAKYAKNLREAFERKGHNVAVRAYGAENRMPTGFRHLYFFLRILPQVYKAEAVIALDSFSVGLSSVLAGRLAGTPTVIRIGGDFLWDTYTERTGHLVPLRRFYEEPSVELSVKERTILRLLRFTFRLASALIFSTEWQRSIMLRPYGIDENRTRIIENYYGEKLNSVEPQKKLFVAGTRDLKWKNKAALRRAFAEAKRRRSDIELDEGTGEFASFQEKLGRAYAVILVSLGDVSPNMALEALRYSKPVILTRETGLRNRLEDAVMWVEDPKDEKEIESKILDMADEKTRERYRKKAEKFRFTHGWEDIADEFMAVIHGL